MFVARLPRNWHANFAGATLERDDIAFAQPSHSSSLFDRVFQTCGESTYGYHALEQSPT